jgi:large subunit ribosomal protein L32
MTAPKRRVSTTRRDSRRSHHALKAPAVGTCPNCGEIKKSHRICRHCGFYRDVQYKAGATEE